MCAFAKRQLNTSVMVEDGQMIVLGGLIDERALKVSLKYRYLVIFLILVTCLNRRGLRLRKRT